MTLLPLRSSCGHCVRGDGEEEGGLLTAKERNVLEIHVDPMFMRDERERKARWRSWSQEGGCRKLYQASWCRGSRQVNEFLEDSWRGFDRSGWSSETSS